MFKRRDWRMFNRDDGNSSSDSDSDMENDGRGALDESDDDGSASSSSSESGSEIESGSGSEGEDEGAAGDDSDSDSEEEDGDDEAAGDDSDESASEETPTVLTRATDALPSSEDAPSKPTDPSKGIAVKCSVCPGVLCLSEKSLQQHLDSKRHKKAMAKQGVGVDDEDVLVDAAAAGRKARKREAANRRADGDESDSLEGYSDGEAETHAERLARLRAQKVFARDKLVVDSDDEDGQRENRREKRGGGRQRQRARATKADVGISDPRGAKKGKPGKRQREAAKKNAAAALEKAERPKDEGEPVSRQSGGPTGDTRPRGNRAAKRAAEAAAVAAAKPAKRGAYDLDAGDLLAPKPTVDKMRGDLRQMKSGRGGAGRGASAGGRGGRGRGKGRGRGRY